MNTFHSLPTQPAEQTYSPLCYATSTLVGELVEVHPVALPREMQQLIRSCAAYSSNEVVAALNNPDFWTENCGEDWAEKFVEQTRTTHNKMVGARIADLLAVPVGYDDNGQPDRVFFGMFHGQDKLPEFFPAERKVHLIDPATDSPHISTPHTVAGIMDVADLPDFVQRSLGFIPAEMGLAS